ncbi:hypothetical protein V9L05_18080 [Bernardetia sp. Wsw4-3y2]|uniref:hypothetical protein n=1 Tax=Bernardetia sp. Wsw4-3y2 TaxID=3127471 RepID=UPI0030D1F869
MKTNQENFKIVDINDLADICGFFNGETPVNNGYGCNHPDVEDSEIVRIVDGEEFRVGNEELRYKILKVALRKKYGSYQNIEKALATEEGKLYAGKIRNELCYDDSFIEKFGCKIIGKCYSFSCPIANRCDVQDLREYESDFLSDYEDEEGDYRTDFMLVTDPELIEKL